MRYSTPQAVVLYITVNFGLFLWPLTLASFSQVLVTKEYGWNWGLVGLYNPSQKCNYFLRNNSQALLVLWSRRYPIISWSWSFTSFLSIYLYKCWAHAVTLWIPTSLCMVNIGFYDQLSSVLALSDLYSCLLKHLLNHNEVESDSWFKLQENLRRR